MNTPSHSSVALALWLKCLLDLPQGKVIQICVEAGMSKPEIDIIVSYRRIELELQEIDEITQSTLNNPAVVRARVKAEQHMRENTSTAGGGPLRKLFRRNR